VSLCVSKMPHCNRALRLFLYISSRVLLRVDSIMFIQQCPTAQVADVS